MKICFLANASSPHTTNWVHCFESLGHECWIVSLHGGGVGAGARTIEVGRLRGIGKARYLLDLPRIRKTLQTIEPDLVVAYYASSYGLVGALTKQWPLVVAVAGSDVLVGKNTPVWRSLLRYVFDRADWVTSWAPHVTDVLTGLGVDKRKISTFPRGIDLDRFPAGPFRSPAKKIISTRWLRPVYDVVTLVRAIGYLTSSKLVSSPLLVSIVGDGSERKVLEEMATSSNVGGQVAFLGNLTQEHLSTCLQAHDIYCSTSLSDGTSASLLEAMSCGLFPVVSRISANVDWIEDGSNGLLFDPRDHVGLANCLVRALTDDAIRANARIINQEMVRDRADASRNTLRFQGIFETVVGSGNGKRMGPEKLNA